MSTELDGLKAALADLYEIERELGEGGMATVYLADDLKHERKVALKVLKPELAAVVGAERFLAEIKTTANLQHPHILPLFDSGEADGFLFYVMPYVEGESLRDRLDREKQLPIEEAVRIATEVAEALHAAHEQGIIHRDIKPANILLSRGRPLVADFGIALAVSAAGGGRLTETGLSLGTPHYMSPEQASGDQGVGPGTDVYALGCVLFEMLAGEPPHGGSTAQAVLARILTETPRDLRELRDTVPMSVAWAARTALARLPADRFASADDFVAAVTGRTVAPSEIERSKPVSPRRLRLAAVLPWGIALALAAALMIRSGTPARTAPLRLTATLPDAAPLVFVGEAPLATGLPALTIAPDGSTIVYVGTSGATTQLYRRRVDAYEVIPLPGTQGAYAPFFSPDGRQVGFFASDQLKITPIEGGEVRVVIDVPDGHMGGWSDDDRIAAIVRAGSGLVIVRPSGLEARTLPIPDLGMRTMQWLPHSEWIVRDCRIMRICAMSTTDGELLYLTVDGRPVSSPDEGALLVGTHPQVTPNGFLVYSAQGESSTRAIRIDLETFATSGEPVEVLRGLRREAFTPIQHRSFSRDGTLVYAAGGDASIGELVWIDGEGREETLPYSPQVYGALALSPSGERVAIPTITDAGPQRLLLLDLTEESSRIWSGPSEDRITQASWWDPSSRYVYVSSTENPMRVIRVDFDVGLGGEVMYEGDRPLVVEGVLPDGRLIVDEYGGGLYLAEEEALGDWSHVESGGNPIRFFEDAFFGAVSPDGRWLSYTSGISGRFEVYVLRFPLEGTPRPVRISPDGGEAIVWSPGGDGLFYRDGGRWYWVALTDDPERPFLRPELFAEGNYLNLGGLEFAVSPRGDRLLVVRGIEGPTATNLNVVTNWFDLLRERVPD